MQNTRVNSGDVTVYIRANCLQCSLRSSIKTPGVNSDFVLADTLIRSPRNYLVYLIIYDNVYRINECHFKNIITDGVATGFHKSGKNFNM